MTPADVDLYVSALNTAVGFRAQPLTGDAIRAAVGAVHELSFLPRGSNTQTNGFADALLNDFAELQTTPMGAFARMFVAFQWIVYLPAKEPHWVAVPRWRDFLAETAAPAAPPAWHDAVATARATIQQSRQPDGSPVYWDVRLQDVADERSIAYGRERFEPSVWTDAGKAALSLNAWRPTQRDALAAMAGVSLDPAAALQLLLLLASLCASADAPLQALASRALELPVSSEDYPNDKMANQLVYLALMTLVDPRGAFVWANPKLQDVLARIEAPVPAQGAGTGAASLRDALEQHRRVLDVTPSYPMVDPYVMTGFAARQTNALAAVNDAWTGFRV